jgi:hypothetical protein
MIQIKNTIVSQDILQQSFVCDLSKCKGACCIQGESGAPLKDEETKILENIYPLIKKYISKESQLAIKQKGVYEVDFDGEKVTPLVGKQGRCAYVYFDENNYAKCAIEKAHAEGEINFKKPISCHLYPIRITKYPTFDAINYHKWEVCNEACKLGKELKITVADFLKEPLIREFGEEWFDELKMIETQLSVSNL